MSFYEISGAIVGACLAVITAGMPAVLALLKIKELHVLVNSRLTELIAMTATANLAQGKTEGREEAAKIAAKLAAPLSLDLRVKKVELDVLELAHRLEMPHGPSDHVSP
jgi:hypothetical protein